MPLQNRKRRLNSFEENNFLALKHGSVLQGLKTVMIQQEYYEDR